MSSFNSFGLFMVVGILYIYVRFFLDRLVRDRADAVVTGVIRGVSVPTKHRWLVLQNSWLPAIAALIVFQKKRSNRRRGQRGGAPWNAP